MMLKVLECMWEMEDINIGLLRPSNIIITIMEFITEVIKLVTMVDVDIGLKIPATLPLVIV